MYIYHDCDKVELENRLRREGRLHYVYVIINTINNNFYIGKRTTRSCYDKYMGSGTILKYAYEKYGVENFVKLILNFYDTEEEAYSAESRFIEDHIYQSDCYNVHRSNGGFVHGTNTGPKSESTKEKLSKLKLGKMNAIELSTGLSVGRVFVDDPKILSGEWVGVNHGLKHSDETKKKMSQSHRDRGTRPPLAKGTLGWTDGVSNKMSMISPGEGWYRGYTLSDKQKDFYERRKGSKMSVSTRTKMSISRRNVIDRMKADSSDLFHDEYPVPGSLPTIVG